MNFEKFFSLKALITIITIAIISNIILVSLRFYLKDYFTELNDTRELKVLLANKYPHFPEIASYIGSMSEKMDLIGIINTTLFQKIFISKQLSYIYGWQHYINKIKNENKVLEDSGFFINKNLVVDYNSCKIYLFDSFNQGKDSQYILNVQEREIYNERMTQLYGELNQPIFIMLCDINTQNSYLFLDKDNNIIFAGNIK